MIILDTNVISELMQREPSQSVIGWLDGQPAESVWTTAITVYELEYGIRLLTEGQRRRAIEFAVRDMLDGSFSGRILAFDTAAARKAGEISAERRTAGRPVEIRDVQITGIARVHGARVATRNVRHFENACEVINPWDS